MSRRDDGFRIASARRTMLRAAGGCGCAGVAHSLGIPHYVFDEVDRLSGWYGLSRANTA